MSQFFKILILSSVASLFSISTPAQELPVNQIKQRIEQYKNDVRGPYHRIRWFCADGTIREPKDPCPDNIGGGIQHASLKDEVVDMGKKHHIYFGDILASLDADDFWDAKNNHSRLKQYQLGKYLMSVDDGWVLKKGQFYRGAIQSEDEEAWGVEFYKKLLKSDDRLRENYYLIRQSLRDIPHNGDDNLAQRLRSESKVIADEYQQFMDIRVKIHSQPDANDIKLVNDFYEKHKAKISPSIDKEFGKLKSTLREFYRAIDIKTLQAVANTIKENNETLDKLKQFLEGYSEDTAHDVVITEIADVLYNIRLGITDFKSTSDRLKMLDLSIKLEDILLKKSNEWEVETLKDQLEKISILGCATVGTGLTEIWEYQSVENKLNLVLGKKEADLAVLNSILESSRGLVEWSTSLVKGNYQDIVDTYTQFEPKAYGFIDDRIRSSVALALGDSVGDLGAFIADKSAISNKVMNIGQQSSIRGLNPGYAKGKLVVVPGNSNNVEVSVDNIYVFQKPPADLKPVAGIMTVSEGNLVSHVQLLARNLGIPNAALSGNNLDALERYNGQIVFYAVSGKGNVIMKPASEMSKEEENLFSEEKKAKNMITVPVANIRLDQKDILNMRDVDAKDSGKLCGPKAANLGQLKSMFPDYVVEGLVIPFGIFRYHMDKDMPQQGKSYWEYLNETFSIAKNMKKEGQTSSEIEAYQLQRLSVLREAITNMSLDKKFVNQLQDQFKDVFGEKIGKVPVFLRSDTNMEDLKEFTGAGLNLTLFNILDEDKIIDGIKKVWASPYTERSFKWRQQYLLNPENVFPSILIIPSVDVEYSGVMITTGINSGKSEDLTVAFSRGAGGAVDGQSAETHLITKNEDILLSPARESHYIRLPMDGGTSNHFTTFESPILNKSNIRDLRSIAEEIRETLPKKTGSDYKGAYDVELGFKDNKLWLFQIRPFVENNNAKSSEYLASIAPKINYKKIFPYPQNFKNEKLLYALTATGIFMSFGFTAYYPIDGYEATGIARILQLERMERDSIKNTRIPFGAHLRLNQIKLNLLDRKNDSMSDMLKVDKSFEDKFESLLPGSGYSATVLDMTDSQNLKYAEYREKVGYQPGSVGKLAVITALFTELAKLCPDSWEQRIYYLKSTKVKARYWGTGDHHTIPIYDMEKDKLTKRQVIANDEFSLYEWADHMLSVSNNGAASVVWREALLMAGLGEEYFNLTEESAEQWFKDMPRDSLSVLANRVVNEPLRKLGIEKDEWRLGSFTGASNKYVSDIGGSTGTPIGLMKYLVSLEQGNVVDLESSLEIKRLMYMTDRRIRYAHSKELDSAAVYFKSGSFYKCDRKKDPDCKQYAGNVYNYMNSVIIVEHPNNGKKYIVCLMTNVLNKNSAGAHMYLASKIDNLIKKSI